MKFVQNIERQIIALGHAISWLALFLVAIVCLSVFLRYVLGLSSLGFDELQWHIYSFGFMMGFSYCTSMETHVRNDLFYSKFSEKTKLTCIVSMLDLIKILTVDGQENPKIYNCHRHSQGTYGDQHPLSRGSPEAVSYTHLTLPTKA